MEDSKRKEHWEKIHQTKTLTDVSWYQPIPSTSIDLILEHAIPKNAKIIDVGGGDSLLADHLLNLGFTQITVLDISEAALNKAKLRLGNRAELVKWIVADVATFETNEKYDVWHDRAAFHFFTTTTDTSSYLKVVKKNLKPNGLLIVGTFSETGPNKCSGIEVHRYSENSLSQLFGEFFIKLKCFTIDHLTPFNTTQNFLFCCFRKKREQETFS
jgi:ubiquinone/menaquinone biosynthesis C-methylase UbiE